MEFLFVLLAFVAGFGLGRVKNAAKLKAAKIALQNAEATAFGGVKKVLGDIKAKL